MSGGRAAVAYPDWWDEVGRLADEITARRITPGVFVPRAPKRNRQSPRPHAVVPRLTTQQARARRRSLLVRDGDTCWYCGAWFGGGAAVPTVEHLIAWSEGGTHDLDNLVLACAECNNDRATWGHRLRGQRHVTRPEATR